MSFAMDTDNEDITENSVRIHLQSFVNPYLFWFCTKKDEIQRSILAKQIAEVEISKNNSVIQIGQWVAVKDENVWKRASILEVRSIQLKKKFTCWLIDYGKILVTENLYQLNTSFVDIPPLVTQGCLNNVVFIEEQCPSARAHMNWVMNYEKNNFSSVKLNFPSRGNIFLISEIVFDRNIKTFYFNKEAQFRNVHLGDILYSDGVTTKSLKKTLLLKKLVVLDDAFFINLLETTEMTDKISHLAAIKNCNTFKHLETYKEEDYPEVSNRIGSRGITKSRKTNSGSSETSSVVSSKSDTDNFEETSNNSMQGQSGSHTEEPTKKEILQRRLLAMRKSITPPAKKIQNIECIQKSDYNYSFESEKSMSPSNGVANKYIPVKDDSNSCCTELKENPKSTRDTVSLKSQRDIDIAKKKQMLLRIKEQIKNNKDSKIINCSSTSNSSFEHDTSSDQLISMKINRESNSSIDTLNSTKQQKHLVNTESTVFMPAGANHSVRPLPVHKKNTKTPSSTDNDWNESGSFSSMDRRKEKEKLEQKHFQNTKSTTFLPAGANYSAQPRKKNRNTYDTDISSKNESSDSLINVLGRERKVSLENEVDDDKEEKPLNSNEPELSDGNKRNSEDDWLNASGNVPKPAEKGLQMHVRFCSCTNCSYWTESSNFEINSNKNIIAPLDTSIRAEPLFKRPEDENIIPVLRRSDLYTHSKIGKITNAPVLSHGILITSPRKHVSELPIDISVQSALKSLGYLHLKKIQTYSLPAILRLHNVCMIGPSKSGKTFCYVSYICSLLSTDDYFYKDLNKFKGPKIIIICPDSKQCEDVYDYLKVILMQLNFRTRIATATYPLKFTDMKLDILITIPDVLTDLCKVNLVNFKRLGHIVLENIDVLLERHKTSLMKILTLADNMLSHRFCDVSVQIIATAEKWTINLENLIKDFKEVPTICISNPLEAAIYGKVEFNINFLESSYKLYCLTDILKNKYKIYKTIVLCNAEEVEMIETYLQREGIEVIALHEKSDPKDEDEFLDLERKWTNQVGGEYMVLVCTDEIFTRVLTVTNATLLVHYSLSTKWSMFRTRFNALIDNITSPLCEDPDARKCVTYILADESCAVQVPKFLEFLNRMNQHIPEKFQEYLKSNKIKKEHHKLNKNISLCPTLKLFGCCKKEHCSYRHIVHENIDVNEDIPQNGSITFQILQINDTTNFTIKLIEHRDFDNNLKKWDDILFENVELELTELMTTNRTRPRRIYEGEMYVYHDTKLHPETFNRCQVSKVVDKNNLDIILVDKCTCLQVQLSEIYELPDLFENKLSRVVNIYISNFLPPYKDEYFSNRCFMELKKGLERENYLNKIFRADICLQLSNTLWVRNVVEEVNLKDVIVTKFNLSKFLFNNKLVEIDSNQLGNLYNLCKEHGIDLPKYEKPRKTLKLRKDLQASPTFAFLDADMCHEVIFAAGISPGEFYIKLRKFENLLSALHQEIKESLSIAHSNRELDIEVGKCYIAQDPVDGDYCRVVVQEKNDKEALCFFVDFGDESKILLKDLKYIQNHLITKLPFQAILCKLHGLQPVLNDWQDEATDILYKYAYEPDSDVLRTLYVQSCFEEKFNNKKMYSVILKDSFGPKNVMINKIILDCGLALPNENEELVDFEIPQPCADEIDEEIYLDVEDQLEIDQRDIQELQEYVRPDENGDNIPDDGVVIFDAMKFADALINNTPEELNRPNRDTNIRNLPELPPMTAVEPVDYFTPDIYWSQTEGSIKMNIKIPYVKEDCYTAKLSRGRFFNIDATANEKKYAASLILYEVVDKTFQHSLVGSEIRIVIKKNKPIEWPRLLMSKDRVRNVHYNLDTLHVEEEKKKLPLDLRDITDDDSSGPDDDVKWFTHSESGSESPVYDTD